MYGDRDRLSKDLVHAFFSGRILGCTTNGKSRSMTGRSSESYSKFRPQLVLMHTYRFLCPESNSASSVDSGDDPVRPVFLSLLPMLPEEFSALDRIRRTYNTSIQAAVCSTCPSGLLSQLICSIERRDSVYLSSRDQDACPKFTREYFLPLSATWHKRGCGDWCGTHLHPISASHQTSMTLLLLAHAWRGMLGTLSRSCTKFYVVNIHPRSHSQFQTCLSVATRHTTKFSRLFPEQF
jgi:hypothetical protein